MYAAVQINRECNTCNADVEMYVGEKREEKSATIETDLSHENTLRAPEQRSTTTDECRTEKRDGHHEVNQ